MILSRNTPPGVYVTIEGGLGNQLFMYACARALSLRSGVPLYMDTASGFELDKRYRRQFSLDAFQVQHQTVPPDFDAFGRAGNRKRYWTRKVNRMMPVRWRHYLEEPRLRNMSFEHLRIGRAVFLEGYWQSEDFFRDYRKTVMNDLRLQISPSALQAKIDEIYESESVFVHIRRRDYDYALPLSYYQRALAGMRGRLKKPRFYFFSDDQDFCQAHFADQPDTHFHLSSTMHKDFEELWIMSHARHGILANSSFSWWAAYLNAQTGGQYICPANWGYDTRPCAEWTCL